MTSTDSNHDIQRVGVVGGGLMGAGIAEVCARAGLDVFVAESGANTTTASRIRIETSLRRAVDRRNSPRKRRTRPWPGPG
nr:3-hydroxyacyl-CoA dehydrogenase NAD-binding domain-containing protein [Streptomyces antimycoticus]